MTRIRITADYDATPDAVWRAVEHVDSHVDWMADAETIRFLTAQTAGVGTSFECVTRIGPVRLTDRMEITEWEPGRAMGVRHQGVVTGVGRFTIEPLDDGRRSRFAWEEELRFPWWLGGPLGSAVGGPVVLRRIWQGNLRRLRPLVERHR
ncbi:MAG TPA: SRPBCC family protein [Ilumatobacteraceae bacterium]|nr:SRPBCC family protein [Ilumatobacteraceae bacterium]